MRSSHAAIEIKNKIKSKVKGGVRRHPLHMDSAPFRRQLLAWYDAYARVLPWRESCDPYRVWVSEIMLQQTRVAAVIEHYRDFLLRFPTVQNLARAREASVLAAWSGLGYYRRARMMHVAAKVIARELNGKFPKEVEALRALPGIGRYTAAAIASIAFGEHVAVVDGNVERVLSRVTGRQLSGEDLWSAAGELLEATRPGDFNQAMMELGAVVCTPRAPACLTCPVVELCATRGELAGAAKAAAQGKREIHYALDCRNGSVFLVQRARDASLMAGMWELPEIAQQQISFAKLKAGSSAHLVAMRRNDVNLVVTLKHSITITDYTVRVWKRAAPAGVRGKWISAERLGRVALTGLARKILRKVSVG